MFRGECRYAALYECMEYFAPRPMRIDQHVARVTCLWIPVNLHGVIALRDRTNDPVRGMKTIQKKKKENRFKIITRCNDFTILKQKEK